MNLVIFTFDLKKQILKNPVKMTPCNIYPSILITVLLIYLLHAFFSFYRLSFLQTEHFMFLFFVYSDIDEMHATHLKYFHYLLYNPNMFSN